MEILSRFLPKTADKLKVSMPGRPKYVDPYLEQIAGPDEMHGLGGDCNSPFCNYEFQPEDEADSYHGMLDCPQCGFTNDLTEMYKGLGKPGGGTISGLSLDEMGALGEQIVMRLGELPNVGTIFPSEVTEIDCVIRGPKETFGCEIKANHSKAQERFKVGGKEERAKKIQYCMMSGMKGALIGVRLNFFTSLAYIFWREGLTDTWIGNDKMTHVGTFNFEDLNPFKSSDPKTQEMAIENANLPDQSEDEFAGVFGSTRYDENPVIGTHFTSGQIIHGDHSPSSWADARKIRAEAEASGIKFPKLKNTVSFNEDQPRDPMGKFTFKTDVKELKVVNKQGKHTHNVRRCMHCGHLNAFHSEHKPGRVACSTCGQDPDRELKLAKIVLATKEADAVAKQMGFEFTGRLKNGHRRYIMTDGNGTAHTVVVGSGAHGKNAAEIDASMARQRMTNCVNGQCYHITTPALPQVDEENPGFVAKAGQTAMIDDAQKFISEIDGGLALVFDVQTGAEDVVPVEQLRAVSKENEPDYLFVYYMSELHVVPFEGIRRYENMLEELLNKFGDSIDNSYGPDPTKVAMGEIREQGFWFNVLHEQLCEPEVRKESEEAIEKWWNNLIEESDWLEEPERWETLDPKVDGELKYT